MRFDPDAYLKKLRGEFDPDAYLRSKGVEWEDTQSGLKDTLNATAGGAVRGLDAAARGGVTLLGKGLAGITAGFEHNQAKMGSGERGALEFEAKRLEMETDVDARNSQNMSLEELKEAQAKLERLGGIRAEQKRLREGADSKLIAVATDEVNKDIKGRRDAALEKLPVDTDFQRSFYGKFVGAVGNQLAQLPGYAGSGGTALVMNFSQMFSQGYDDAVESGADEDTALASGMLNMPTGALEYVADKFALGGVFDLFKAGKLPKKMLGKELKKVIGAAVAEGGTEGLQQTLTNVVAKDVLGYDAERDRTQGVGESAAIGGLLGGSMRGVGAGLEAVARKNSDVADEGTDERAARPYPGRDDTGINTPEAVQTLQAQQKALIEGRQKAQMFPKGTRELELPEGFDRVLTPRGVFHFDPEQVTAERIVSASQFGRENEVLGLGPASKAEIEARSRSGEPVSALVETDDDGREVKAALVTPGTLRATETEMRARKAEQNGLELKRPEAVVQGRGAGSVVENLLRREAQAAGVQTQAQERVRAERETKQRELAEKRARFDDVMKIAGDVYTSPQRTFAQVQGALTQARHYAEDNSLGLKQEQRDLARRATAQLEKTLAQMEPQERARQATENRARLELEARAEAEKMTRAKAERAQFKAQATAGVAADGGLDYAQMRDDRLAELAQGGDKRADRELDRRILGEEQGGDGADLRTVLAEIKLPTSDAALGAELGLLKQELKAGEAARYFSTKRDSLDRVAEALRERGFSQVQTPDDVVRLAGEAFRGKRILPAGGGLGVEFARADGERAARLAESDARARALVLANRASESVRVVDAPDVVHSLEQKEAERWAKEKVVGRPLPNADTGGVFYVTGAGVSKMVSQGGGKPFKRERIAAIYNIEQLVKEAKGVALPSPDGEISISRVHHLYAPWRWQGKTHRVRLIAREFANAQRPDVHSYRIEDVLVEKEKPTGTSSASATRAERQTPSAGSVITMRELMEEDKPQVELAQPRKAGRGGIETLSQEQVKRALAAVRRANPALLREYEIEAGFVEEILQKYATKAGMKLGAVPAEVQAAVTRVEGMRGVIALSAEAFAREGKAASLLTHEVAHTYWDTLPEQTRRILRELRRSEITGKSGPLYRDGKLQSELDGIEDNSEWGVKEWFAERVARINEAWAGGRIAEAGKADTLLKRVAYEMREWVRRIWESLARARGIDAEGELFEAQFRKFWLGGADAQVGRRAGLAFAKNANVEFAQAPKKGPLSDDEMAAKVGPASALPGAREEVGAEPKWLPGREELGEALDALEKALPKIGRKDALLAEWRNGKAMRDQGLKLDNEDAISAGQELVNRAKRALDEEFTGWDNEAYANPTPSAKPTPSSTGGRPPVPPKQIDESAQPDDAEPSPFEFEAEAEMPVRKGQFDAVHGQSAVDPSWLGGKWAVVKRFLQGFRGSVPELPTFVTATTDRFTKRFGAHFYDKVKAGQRLMSGINDYVQKEAEQKVARITRPLIEARGARINANDYARLKKLQERKRIALAEGRAFPAESQASLTALQSKLEASPYVLFQKLAMVLDLNWRQQNLKDSAGNPIKLPNNINPAEVKAELTRLSAAVEASPHRELIGTALERHLELVKSVAEELKGRDLMAAEQLQNPFYFPHLTLEVQRGDKTEQRELRIERVKPGTEADFRGYLIDPVGSAKPIETDYVRAMYYHLTQVEAHNQKADVVRDYFRTYDVRKEVEERAKALGKTRGAPVSWEQAFHEEYGPQGYVLYGTDSGDAFPSVSIDRDKLAERLGVMLTSDDLQAQLAELGVKGVKLLPEDIRETMQMGAKEIWVLPAEVASALRGIAKREAKTPGTWDEIIGLPVNAWKKWKLFAPWNHFRYEYGNVVADLEKVFSTDPAAFKYMPGAAKELRAFWTGSKPSETLRAAMKEGVLNAVTAQEMKALPSLRAFEGLQTTGQKTWAETKAFISAPLSNLTRLVSKDGIAGRITSVEQSALREATMRYAKFKADYERIKNGARPVYSGAYWKNIEAMEDSKPGAGDAAVRKAAAISKATFGDYADISESGQVLREKFIPFYSWMEVNFKYHANLLRNLRDMVRAGEKSRLDAAGAGARAAAVFAGSMTARAAGAFALRLALPYVSVSLWNASHADLEDELSEEDKRRFHIVLGRDDEGKVLVAYANTALMDVMKWFSGPELARVTRDWVAGRTDFATAFATWRDRLLPDFANNTVGSFGPLAQIPTALGLKKRLFPDVTDPRTIPAYDMRRTILGMATDDFTADMIERVVNKDYHAAKDIGDWTQQLILQVRQRDPEAWAYYTIRDKAADWAEKKTGASRDTSYDAPDQQVLRNFRKAIYTGDVEAATKFYLRALDYGYTAERFAASVRAQDPLAMLAKKDGLRREFVEGLSEFDREQLTKAFRYYERMDVMRGRERVLFPRDASGSRGEQEFQRSPRLNQLQGLLDASMKAKDEDVRRRADRALERSLR